MLGFSDHPVATPQPHYREQRATPRKPAHDKSFEAPLVRNL